MTLDDAIHRANIILPEHKKELKSFLEKLPDGINNWLYSENINDLDSLYQGDILIDVPTCFIDEDGDTIVGEDLVALVSNACDMQHGRKDFIIVSPLVTLEEYREHLISHSQRGVDNILKDIRENMIFSFFYMPARDTLPESFIDFSRMISISNIYLNNIKSNNVDKCLLSLSQYGFYLFLIKLTYHLARMEKS